MDNKEFSYEYEHSSDSEERIIKIFETLLKKTNRIEKRYLSIDELSQYIGIKKGTIYQWTNQRRIPYSKLGKVLKFDKQKIDNWLKKKEVKVFDYRKALDL